MKRLTLLLLALALLLCACTPKANTKTLCEILFFSAGKADAILIRGENCTVLIDAGKKGFGREILAELRARGVEKLDLLIVSHFDKDHIGGIPKLLGEIPVTRILQSNCPKDTDEYERYLEALEENRIVPETVREPLELSFGSLSFTVDPPIEESYEESESNNSSLIVSLCCGSCRLLFPGDAENLRLREWCAAGHGSYDFVKVPHHGVWHKALTDFVDQTSPKAAVVTSSAAEPEDEKTVELFERYGVELYYTRVAPVLLRCDGQTLTLTYLD